MFKQLLILAGVAAMVGGCEAIPDLTPLPADAARQASVGTIEIVNQSAEATEENLGMLKGILGSETAACARGPTKYDMIVSIEKFQTGSEGKALLLGSSHVIQARIKLVDPTSKAVGGEYFIFTARGGVGLIGMAELSTGIQGTARVFAQQACRKIFKFAN